MALTSAFFCDSAPGKGLITTATNSSQPALAAVDITFGTKTGSSTTGTSLGINVTASAGYTLLVWAYSHDATITGLTAASGVSAFTLRSAVGSNLRFYTGYVTTAMVAVAVTVTLSGNAGVSMVVVPIIGAYDPTKGFFDTNGALPATAGPNDATGMNIVISSTNTKALLTYAVAGKGPLVNFTDPAGWTGQVNTGYVLADLAVWTKFVTSAQTLLAVAAGTSDSHETSSLGDAINGIY